MGDIIGRLKRMLQRAGTAKVGWYAALAALLVLLGSASYAYRNRTAAPMEPRNEPRAVMAVRTPDPVSAWVMGVEPTPEPTPEPLRFVWPVEGDILGEYADDHMVWSGDLNQWQIHPALDIAAAPGEAVAACADGVVSEAWEDGLWGRVIRIAHPEGYGSVYAGLSTLRLVSIGESVAAGQIISAVGDTAACEASMPSHLHFELDKSGISVNFKDLMAKNTNM